MCLNVLGPLSFLLYIDDLPRASNKLTFSIFADDTNILYSSKDAGELRRVINEELGKILKYCVANMLSINFKKTKRKTNIRQGRSQYEANRGTCLSSFFRGKYKILFEGERMTLAASKFTNSFKKMLTQQGIMFNDDANRAVA